MEHVHGLGIDPADGTLYAATHFGLFRVLAVGGAERVGDTAQDTMGFTVVGAGRFLGSGHPEVGDQDLPPLLGLIESSDAGRQWNSVSLLGAVDFHALVFRHGTVYGYDATSGRFMTSTDRASWDQRSQVSGLVSFAVDPADAEHIVATTTQGLLVSRDGGRTWGLADSPLMAFVSWSEDGQLAGIDPTGKVYVSADSGTSWSAAGELNGQPQALLVIDAQTLIAAIDGGIYASTDGGATWQVRYRSRAT